MKLFLKTHMPPLAFSCLSLFFFSCKKFVEIPAPENQVVSSTAFADDKTAVATINGIYSKMMASSNYLSAGSATIYPAMSADELYYFSTSTRDEFILNKITVANNLVLESYLWNPTYSQIYAANSCIEGVLGSQSLSTGTRDMIRGEALFIRSFLYFHLTNLFGDVPLITNTDYNANKDLARTAISTIYEQIIKDLEQSVNLLGDDYASTGRSRPNKATVQALLARVYLYNKEWAKAESLADAIINDGRYILEPDLNSVFLSGSREAIWQLEPVTPERNTWEGYLLNPSSSSATPGYLITTTLLNAFETGDLRKISWIKSRVYRGQTVYYPYKYKIRQGSPATEFYSVFRLAEMYLTRAECRAELNDLESAASDLNAIRVRAGLPEYQGGMDKGSLLNAILQERRKELFVEWGNRWYDLKRTGAINQVLGALKPDTWTPTAALYPIPYAQRLINTSLTQNPGYE